MTTISRHGRALGGWAAAALAAALLVSACGGNDAVEVSPAKPDDEAPTLEPAEETEADSQPDPPAEAPPDEPVGGTVGSRPVVRAEAEQRNGWTRLSPPADLLSLQTGAAGLSIVAGAAGEGWLSTDGGQTWARLDWPGERRAKPAVGESPLDLAVAGFAPAAGVETAPLLSSDAGFTWEELAFDAPAVSWYVLDSFLYAISGRGLLASNDGGATGTLVGEPGEAWPRNFTPAAVVVDPRDFNRFAVVSQSEGGAAAIQLSEDRGGAFAPLVQGFDLWGVTVAAFTAIGPMVMSQGPGVLMSFDGGTTWSAQNVGLEPLQADGRYAALVDLVWLPQASRPIVATAETVFAFDPGGWRPHPGPGAPIRAIAVQAPLGEDAPERVLAATADGIWAIPAAELR